MVGGDYNIALDRKWSGEAQVDPITMREILPPTKIQVTMPFDCVDPASGIGLPSMRAAPDVICDDSVTSYIVIKRVAMICFCALAFLYNFITQCIRMSFHWQFGNNVRGLMPLYVAVVEVSVQDMKGWMFEIRRHLETTILALQTYQLPADHVRRRGLVDTMEKFFGNVVHQLESHLKGAQESADAMETMQDSAAMEGEEPTNEELAKEAQAERREVHKQASVKAGTDNYQSGSSAWTFDRWKRSGGRVLTYGWSGHCITG